MLALEHTKESPRTCLAGIQSFNPAFQINVFMNMMNVLFIEGFLWIQRLINFEQLQQASM